jgi:transcriptional regulator with XRE-family HTH domain
MNGTALKLLRQYHRMKGVELAAEIDISCSHISQLESGKSPAPLAILLRYADYFKVSLSGLMELVEAVQSDDLKELKDEKLQRVYQWWLDVQEYKETL